MNTPVSTPRISAFELSMANGEIQDSERRERAALDERDRGEQEQRADLGEDHQRWMCADSSVPSTQIVVITAMIRSVKTTFARVESRRRRAPNRSNV